MKKMTRTILTTAAIATGFIFIGNVAANADTTTPPAHSTTTYHPTQPTSTSNTTTALSMTSSTASTSSSTSSTSYSSSTIKSYVLTQMASRTGVSASTWNTIITRESNWEPYVVNSSSGAYGLFQNMHISSGTVAEQVDAAVSLYEAQGLSAWGY